MIRIAAAIYDRFERYWLSELGLGNRSRLGNVCYWLTLGPIRRFFRLYFDRWFRLDVPDWIDKPGQELYVSKAPVRWQGLLNPICWMRWIANFSYEWLASRPILALGPALPAVAAAIVFSFIGFTINARRDSWRDGYYRQLLGQATSDGDDELTRIALAKLVDRDPDQVNLQLQQAILDEKIGNRDVAVASMTKLAERRNPIAALWLARKLFPLDQLANWPQDRHQQFRSLLAIALEESPTNGNIVSARVLMAQYLVGTGAANDAVVTLETVADQHPELMVPTASLYAQMGNRAKAMLWAERAEKHYQERLVAAPADIGLRMNLAKALLIQQRAEAVAVTLSDGFKITKDPQLLNAGGEALANWANQIQSTDPPTEQNLLKRLQLLQRAVELAPQNAIVLESLIQAVLQCTDNTNSKIAALRSTLLTKVDAEKLHFIEGTVELLKGNIEKADAHLQLASANTSSIPGVLNNLAVVMSQRENPDLEKALALSNAALKSAPDHPYLRETRGQILLKMRQFNQAILDLEFALAAKELHGPVHKSLAEAYAAIGLEDVAAKHLALSK